MDSSLFSALFALLAAATWGSGDFTGGMASRRVGTFITIWISYSVGMVALVIAALATREAFPPAVDIIWGALAGLSGWIGLGFLLRGFAAGRMGIVAPISATLATAIPVLLTALAEGLPTSLQMIGFALALSGIWLLTLPERIGNRPAGLELALLAGLGFAGFFTALDQVSEGSVFWPLVSGRAACIVLMAAFAILTRRPISVPRSLLGIIVLAGLLDISGNLFFLLAVQAGRLDIATVLGSLYPAVTTLLAWIIAREHMTRLQVIGVTAAVLAIIMITL